MEKNQKQAVEKDELPGLRRRNGPNSQQSQQLDTSRMVFTIRAAHHWKVRLKHLISWLPVDDILHVSRLSVTSCRCIHAMVMA